MVAPGAVPGRFGTLKTPTNAYATFIEPFHPCNTGGLGRNQNVCGGNFWYGRAEGNEIPLFPDGATAHIGDEIFYTADGTDLEVIHPGVREYAVYLGPVADQALNPFPNPVEQNLDPQKVCKRIARARYSKLFTIVWGEPMDCSDNIYNPDLGLTAYEINFRRIAVALSAWQASDQVNSFSSKRDVALQAELTCACQDPGSDVYPGEEVCSNVPDRAPRLVCNAPDYLNSPGEFPLVGLTDKENLGHDLFYGITPELNPEGKNANCAACHSDNPPARGGGGDTGAELFQLYAADDYHNIGTPPNPEIPVSYDSNGDPIDPDLGIAGHAGDDYPPGFFKTPTLRNVDKRIGKGFTKAYAHNGWFKSLESIVHFYNTAFLGNCVITDTEDCTGRGEATYESTTAATFGVTRCPEDITTEKDALANNCWPAPAYSNGAIPFLVGDLGLTADEEAAIVAYMETLTDLYTPRAPQPYR